MTALYKARLFGRLETVRKELQDLQEFLDDEHKRDDSTVQELKDDITEFKDRILDFWINRFYRDFEDGGKLNELY